MLIPTLPLAFVHIHTNRVHPRNGGGGAHSSLWRVSWDGVKPPYENGRTYRARRLGGASSPLWIVLGGPWHDVLQGVPVPIELLKGGRGLCRRCLGRGLTTKFGREE